jgi:hypothetical protein
MTLRRAPKRYLCCFLLILAGVCGILLSPAVGVKGGLEFKSFNLNDEVRNYTWGTAVTTSEYNLPYITNQRGLMFMNCFLAGSLMSFFSGVHWLTRLRRH